MDETAIGDQRAKNEAQQAIWRENMNLKYNDGMPAILIDLRSNGSSLVQVFAKLGISESTYHDWQDTKSKCYHHEFAVAARTGSLLFKAWGEQLLTDAASGANVNVNLGALRMLHAGNARLDFSVKVHPLMRKYLAETDIDNKVKLLNKAMLTCVIDKSQHDVLIKSLSLAVQSHQDDNEKTVNLVTTYRVPQNGRIKNKDTHDEDVKESSD